MSLLKVGNISNSDQYFYIDRDNAIKLELAFNQTEKGKEWTLLGDILYNFGVDKEVELNWKINKVQFDYLRNLANEKNIKKLNKKE
jgi:hypothetical protein